MLAIAEIVQGAPHQESCLGPSAVATLRRDIDALRAIGLDMSGSQRAADEPRIAPMEAGLAVTCTVWLGETALEYVAVMENPSTVAECHIHAVD
jgi:hypothetical protein